MNTTTRRRFAGVLAALALTGTGLTATPANADDTTTPTCEEQLANTTVTVDALYARLDNLGARWAEVTLERDAYQARLEVLTVKLAHKDATIERLRAKLATR